MKAPVLVERDHSSLTLGWPVPSNDVKCYEVEMSTAATATSWTSLSSSIKNNILRKKNLEDGIDYFFRYRYLNTSDVWSEFSPSTENLQVLGRDFQTLPAPVLSASDGSSITVKWEGVPNADGYALRFREEGSVEWKKVEAMIKGTVAKKKGLLADKSYHFAILPVGGELLEGNWSYSPSSVALQLPKLSPFYRELLPNNTLIKHSKDTHKPVPISADELLAGGKVVGLYFSAHWCPPCRQFTPQLITLYNQCQAIHKPFEVIFCSADHSEEEFEEYYASMPWAAIDYDHSVREQITGRFKVSGIPRLVILSPTGKVIDDNAVGKPLSTQMVDCWIAQSVL